MDLLILAIAIMVFIAFICFMLWLFVIKWNVFNRGEECIICGHKFLRIIKLHIENETYPICDDDLYIAKLLINEYPMILDEVEKEIEIDNKKKEIEKQKNKLNKLKRKKGDGNE